MVKPSAFLAASFVALAVLLATAFVAAVRVSAARRGMDAARSWRSALLAAAGAGAWLALTGALAAAGKLGFSTFPPAMFPVIIAGVALAVGVGVSRLGERLALGLPLTALVGAQGFRLPLEMMMHRAYAEGVMPVQMSYSGLNFDIATGGLAIVAAALLAAGRLPRWGVGAWNAIGFLLLVNIVTIAVLSTPTPLRVFHDEPANVWITHFPFVWLPTMMVPLALLGHILVFRRLRHERAARASSAAPAAGAPLLRVSA